jgi:2-oxoglutarate dehydrogenase E1 component
VPRAVPLSRLFDSFLDGTSSVYLEELQRAWEADPSSVDESWDNFFRNFVAQASPSAGVSGQTIQESMQLLLLVRAYQVNGHMMAKLDPLGLEDRDVPEDLNLGLYGFTDADLDREFFLGVWRMSGFLSENRPVLTLREILNKLQQAYLKALVWFWIIDETLVLTSMLSVCRLNEVGTCQVMEQVMIMVMMVMTTR